MSKRIVAKNFAVLISRLFVVPWQISVVMAIELFVVMRWITPSIFNTPRLVVLSNNIFSLATIVSCIFLIYAAVSYFLNRIVTKKREQAEIKVVESPVLKDDARPTEWSIELLRTLEWQRFEMLFVEYFQLLGKRVETVFHTADGGIDARIYPRDSNTLEYAVQCKAGNSEVGIKPIWELYGVMAHESAGKGIYLTASIFSADAKQFADEHKEKLFLIDGPRFIAMISKLPDEKKAKLLMFATEGQNHTPS